MANLNGSTLLAAAMVVGATLAAPAAEGGFGPALRHSLFEPVAAIAPDAGPLSNYDPYTKTGPCTLGSPNGGPKCKELIPPDRPL
jgi:hypothetical protein